MKPSRSSAPSTDFGLLAWLEETRVALPLKGVECRFDVTGAIACVELDQIYHQNATRPLDCMYTFPLPSGAAVYRCEVHINGRVIRAKVESKEAARKIYRAQKAAGHRAALVETVRANLFTLALGNVQPDDVIVVRFAWFQELDRAGEALRLLVPTCPGVRYIAGKPLLRSSSGMGTVDDTDEVPDASRLTPPRIDALHPDAAYFAMQGRLSTADVQDGTVSSPTHPIFVREKDAAVTVELSGKADVPDRDFVLTWEEPKARQLAPQSWSWKDGHETYALIQLRAPTDVPMATNFPQDFYFLVDRSGSMEGLKWARTCEALRAFVDLLGVEDRVWITFFESALMDFAEAPMLASDVRKDRKFQQISRIGTAGGTELRLAAEHVLGKIAAHFAGRRTTLVLVTDGQVGNEPAILEAFQRMPDLEVHTFGIDTAVNDAFLKALARQHRGGCWLQTPNDDIAATVRALGDRLRRPVITDLQIGGSWVAGRSVWPSLHAGQVVRVALRGSGAEPIVVTGRLPDGREHWLTVETGAVGSEAIKLLWAKERISSLLETKHAPEAIALAIQHNLICEGAAFIAWDESEKVQIAEELVVVPALSPWLLKSIARQASLNMLEAISPIADEAAGANEVKFDMAPGADGPDESDLHLSECQILDRDWPLQFKMPEAQLGMEPEGLSNFARQMLTDGAETQDPQHRRERRSRWDSLAQAIDAFERLRSMASASEHRALAERHIRSVLEGPPGGISDQLDRFHELVDALSSLLRKLRQAAAPDEVSHGLTTWLLETTPMDRERAEAVRNFIHGLDQLPFKAGMAARAQRWRDFLEGKIGVQSPASAVAAAWLTEMEGLAESQWNREDEKISPSRFSHLTHAQETNAPTHAFNP